jgi:hypothetical protein
VKYKCIKTQCPVCGNSGSLQLFINRQGKITYARVRHYQGKGKYTYCKIEELGALKTLLLNKGISLSTDEAELGQVGQGVGLKTHDPQLSSSSFNSENKWAGSSARIEHHPPKVGVVGSNPIPPATVKPPVLS